MSVGGQLLLADILRDQIDKIDRPSQSGADTRPEFDHHNAPPMEPPLVGGMPHVASEAFCQ